LGPTIILDKSAFEALSFREHSQLDFHFMENVTPILGMELLGDLAASGRGTRSADEFVTELASKFGGSGTSSNVDFWTACRISLLGASIAMDGRIAPENMTVVPAEGGGYGALVEPSALNEAIMRWSAGMFDEFELEIATHWRRVTKAVDQDAFVRQLEQHHVILPRADSGAELVRKADYLLGKSGLQDVWLEWMIAQLALGRCDERAVRLRWRIGRRGGFSAFAPYAAYCLRVHFLLLVFTHNGLIPWNPTNLLDIQYLYYAPFCQVFSSNDALHSVLAPYALRPDQLFIPGTALKADLRQLADRRDSLSERERVGESFALGSYPPPSKDSVVSEAWQMYMRPWNPSMVNQAFGLDAEERAAAVARVQGMFGRYR
jgi:hypothetical protein